MFTKFKENFARYPNINSYDILKLFALFLMVVDHLGMYVFPESDMFRVYGRLSFPIFFFLIGYSANFIMKFELIVLALLLQALDLILHYPLLPLNILFTVFLGQAIISFAIYFGLMRRFESTCIFMFVLGIICLPTYILTEYSSLGVMFMVLGFLTRKAPRKENLLLFIATFGLYYFVEVYSPPYGEHDKIFLGIAFIYMISLMYRFDIKEAKLAATHPKLNKNIIVPLLYISRNSLYFYAFQLAIFRLATVYLHPEKYTGFRLF